MLPAISAGNHVTGENCEKRGDKTGKEISVGA